MPGRIASGDPGVLELVACYGLLVPTIYLAAFVGGRIYAGAILSGGGLSVRRLISVVARPQRAS